MRHRYQACLHSKDHRSSNPDGNLLRSIDIAVIHGRDGDGLRNIPVALVESQLGRADGPSVSLSELNVNVTFFEDDTAVAN